MGSCRRQGSIRNGHKFNFAIESGDLCPQETMAVVNSKTAIRGDLRPAGRALKTACLAGNSAEKQSGPANASGSYR